jgi:hypothetical protein
MLNIMFFFYKDGSDKIPGTFMIHVSKNGIALRYENSDDERSSNVMHMACVTNNDAPYLPPYGDIKP